LPIIFCANLVIKNKEVFSAHIVLAEGAVCKNEQFALVHPGGAVGERLNK